MPLIYESEHFVVESVDPPLLDRNDGGHIAINPKVKVSDRQELSPRQAIEVMRLTMVVGEAMTIGMNKNGVDIGRINYQDNGNWGVFLPEGPFFHIHLYGRAKSAKTNLYGQALQFPHRNEYPEFYSDFKPLTEADVVSVRNEIQRIFADKKYSDANWFPETVSIDSIH
jgi:diadenosine tetraphosphate (Ap4A) HIT family hydrolase